MLDLTKVIRLRCRETKCYHYNKNNGCNRDEIIIDSKGKCNCNFREE